MDQNKPTDTPAAGTPPPSDPIIPQPLDTGEAAKPTEMPMGTPTPPAGGMPDGGLPAQLEPTGTVKAGGGSKSMIMWVIVILLIIGILGAGGYYFYTMQNQPAPEEEMVATPDPDLVNLQNEANEIDIVDPQEEITEVTTEISALDASPSPSTTASASARPR